MEKNSKNRSGHAVPSVYIFKGMRCIWGMCFEVVGGIHGVSVRSGPGTVLNNAKPNNRTKPSDSKTPRERSQLTSSSASESRIAPEEWFKQHIWTFILEPPFIGTKRWCIGRWGR